LSVLTGNYYYYYYYSYSYGKFSSNFVLFSVHKPCTRAWIIGTGVWASVGCTSYQNRFLLENLCSTVAIPGSAGNFTCKFVKVMTVSIQGNGCRNLG